MTDDQMLNELAELLWDESYRVPGRGESAFGRMLRLADALLPVIREAQAQALRNAADVFDGSDKSAEAVVKYLNARARQIAWKR